MQGGLHLVPEFIKSKINQAANRIKQSLLSNKKVIFAGNGGSFSDAQHLAAEFVARLNIDRAPFAAVALGTNSSSSTDIANDYGFDQ